MDIGSKAGFPAGHLSNFHPHPFVFRGVPVASMEGFLQSLKYSNPEMQKEVCKLVGLKAKRTGAKKNWQRDQILYWQGVEYPRKSQAYQDLLDEVYKAMFDQNPKALSALMATGQANLSHSIGRTKESETVLTQQEFCSRLMGHRRFINHKKLLQELRPKGG